MFDIEYYNKLNIKNSFIAGVDEVGRGPLAGPVVACVVLAHQKQRDELEFINFLKLLNDLGVTDSKKLTTDKRKKIVNILSLEIIAHQKFQIKISKNMSLIYFIQEISVDEIDEINILNASLKAMKVSFESVFQGSGILLIDGNKKFITKKNVALETIVKGDSKSLLIGLASIIAKEYRDNLMKSLSMKYPQYSWEKNAGYGTKVHLDSINKYGVTSHHRKSFKGVKEIYEERGFV
jgi:ribonuclease HII